VLLKHLFQGYFELVALENIFKLDEGVTPVKIDLVLAPFSKSGMVLSHSVVVEAIHPFKIALTPMSHTYKAFQNLHMMWM